MSLKPATLQHRRTRLAVAILLATGLAHAAAAEVDPEADGILGAMSDYMTGVMAFSVDLEANAYLQVPVGGGIGAALDEMRVVVGTEVTGGADLFFESPYGGLMTEVTDGEVIGQTMVGGVLTNHLHFRARDVDWQTWISAEGDPLPLRYVITSKWVAGGPQVEVRLSNVDTTVVPAAGDFSFAPAATAREVTGDDSDSLVLLIEG